jgi:hypothetical protein
MKEKILVSTWLIQGKIKFNPGLNLVDQGLTQVESWFKPG